MRKIVFIILIIVSTGWISADFFSMGADSTSIEELGSVLFNEKILSKDSSVSCSSCHKPEYAFADTSAFSIGIEGKLTKRNTPSVLNMKNRPYFFYDGRASTLEEQSLKPIANPDEMGLPIKDAVTRLQKNKKYVTLFKAVFNQLPDSINLGKAIAAYEKTLETSNSKFDEWSNNESKLSASEERGRKIFVSDKAKCFDCHFREDFTDDEFKNIGLFNGKLLNDSGRILITGDHNDLGKFKTPGLRNVAVTAPYMHNGMFNTLEDVVNYYNEPGKHIANAQNTDTSLQKPLGLTAKEKKDLVAFLKTLTDRKYIHLMKETK